MACWIAASQACWTHATVCQHAPRCGTVGAPLSHALGVRCATPSVDLKQAAATAPPRGSNLVCALG